MEDISIAIEIAFPLFISAVIILVVIVALFKRLSVRNGNGRKPNQNTEVHYGVQPRERYERKVASAHDAHVADAIAHFHKGREEHYEEIVGSLGDVNDEGCADLDGVRFIAHDLAYDTTEEEHGDMSKIARAMVLGEILNDPRFRKPYRRK